MPIQPPRQFRWQDYGRGAMALVLAWAIGAVCAGCNAADPSRPEPRDPLSEIVTVDQEPAYSPGLSNTISWAVTGGGEAETIEGWSYLAERAGDPDFTVEVVRSEWQTEDEFTFPNLTDAETYHFRVKGRDNLGAETEWSAVVSSTQDAVAPVAAVLPLATDQTSLLFNLEIAAEDAGSGLAALSLWFRSNGGEWRLHGPATAGTFSFQADEGGPHEFFARATDVAGNSQPEPDVAQSGTLVPEPIILVDGGGYAWDVTNAVLRHNIHLQWWQFGLGRFTIKPAIEPEMIGPGGVGYPGPENTVDVVAVEIGGDARAYKIGDLAGREVADDVVNGVPLAATY